MILTFVGIVGVKIDGRTLSMTVQQLHEDQFPFVSNVIPAAFRSCEKAQNSKKDSKTASSTRRFQSHFSKATRTQTTHTQEDVCTKTEADREDKADAPKRIALA
jgi:hypothetical protein